MPGMGHFGLIRSGAKLCRTRVVQDRSCLSLVYAVLHFTFSSASYAELVAGRGCAIVTKNASLFSRILSMTIIRRYFAECVIVLILRTTVDS